MRLFREVIAHEAGTKLQNARSLSSDLERDLRKVSGIHYSEKAGSHDPFIFGDSDGLSTSHSKNFRKLSQKRIFILYL